MTLGGDLVRLSPKVSYSGPGGDAELFGLYFTGEGQHHEHRSLVDHNVSHTRSRVDYKGALSGEDAHAVWIGDVIIGEGTQGTDSYEHNRNLVLTDGTRVDSVPNLEIFTGEVEGAGHASTSGRLDDIHLFYLQSRGIPADEARRLVVRGFFAEIIDRIESPNCASASWPRSREAGAHECEETYIRVCALGDLPEEGALGVEVNGTPVAVVRSEGEIYAISDLCSHAEVNLSEGEVEDGTIECWLHGSCFDLRTGKPLNPPATQAVPTYRVKIDGDDVLVSLDTEKA